MGPYDAFLSCLAYLAGACVVVFALIALATLALVWRVVYRRYYGWWLFRAIRTGLRWLADSDSAVRTYGGGK